MSRSRRMRTQPPMQMVDPHQLPPDHEDPYAMAPMIGPPPHNMHPHPLAGPPPPPQYHPGEYWPPEIPHMHEQPYLPSGPPHMMPRGDRGPPIPFSYREPIREYYPPQMQPVHHRPGPIVTPNNNSAPYKILCITNINHKISDQAIKDALTRDFCEFGNISVSVCHDNDERLAYIYFRHYEEARAARYARSRTILFDRPIEIEPIYEQGSSPSINSLSNEQMRRRSTNSPEYPVDPVNPSLRREPVMYRQMSPSPGPYSTRSPSSQYHQHSFRQMPPESLPHPQAIYPSSHGPPSPGMLPNYEMRPHYPDVSPHEYSPVNPYVHARESDAHRRSSRYDALYGSSRGKPYPSQYPDPNRSSSSSSYKIDNESTNTRRQSPKRLHSPYRSLPAQRAFAKQRERFEESRRYAAERSARSNNNHLMDPKFEHSRGGGLKRSLSPESDESKCKRSPKSDNFLGVNGFGNESSKNTGYNEQTVNLSDIKVPSVDEEEKSDATPIDKSDKNLPEESIRIEELTSTCDISWKSTYVLKNCGFPSEAFLCLGDESLIKKYITDLDDVTNQEVNYLRINQRLRLHQSKLDEVAKKMQAENSSMFVIVDSAKKLVQKNTNQQSDEEKKDDGNSGESELTMSRPLKNLVGYLRQKDAAGIVSITPIDKSNDNSKLLYIFPPCNFSINLIKHAKPDLNSYSFKEDYLVGIIVRGN